jgi:predicted transcriptional regulator
MQADRLSILILRVFADKHCLKILTVANDGNASSHTLQSTIGFSKKQHYSRTQQLIECGLVKRKHGIFSLTSFGKVIYRSKLKIDAAFKEYYTLKAVDSILATKEISERNRKELINNIVIDNGIKMVLLANKS